MIEPSNEKIEVFLENMWTSQGEMNTWINTLVSWFDTWLKGVKACQ
jgi:hypothetical protein